MFTKDQFAGYIYLGESITCETQDGITLTATIYHDDDTTRPDDPKRQDGFWPSLDESSDGYIGHKSKATLRKHTARLRKVIKSWEAGDWFYCGVAVVATKSLSPDVEARTGDYHHAIWGVECNYPTFNGYAHIKGHDNSYICDLANECAMEAMRDILGAMAAHHTPKADEAMSPAPHA